MNLPEFIFLSDNVSKKKTGGAEFSFLSLAKTCPQEFLVIDTQEIQEEDFELLKDKTWIIGNCHYLLERKLLRKLPELKIKYFSIEFDYKICKYRNPLLCEHITGTPCDCEIGEIIDFLYGANKIFFMSDAQRVIYETNVFEYGMGIRDDFTEYNPKGTIGQKSFTLSSIFEESFFDKIEKIND